MSINNIRTLARSLESLNYKQELNIFCETMDMKKGILRGEFRNNHLGIAYHNNHFLNIAMLGNKDDLDCFYENYLKEAMLGKEANFYYEACPRGKSLSPILNYEWIIDNPEQRKFSILSGHAYGPYIDISSFKDLKDKEKIKKKA